MATSGLLLALAAASIHAGWNTILARTDDTEAAAAVALALGALVFAPAAILLWRVEPAAWKYIGASSAFQFVYWTLLATAYRRAELSVVYPVARGLAPVLVLVAGVALLGAESSPTQAAGVCTVALGVVLVGGLGARAGRQGVLFGIAIAVCIAGYTLVDNEGVRHANPVTYLELELLLPAIAFAGVAVARRGLPAVRRQLRLSVALAGIGTFGAYALVLLALRIAPAAAVSAVRETSVVIAAALARLVLREPVGRGRLAGAVLVAGGVALLAL